MKEIDINTLDPRFNQFFEDIAKAIKGGSFYIILIDGKENTSAAIGQDINMKDIAYGLRCQMDNLILEAKKNKKRGKNEN